MGLSTVQGVQIVVKNQCGSGITVGQMENGHSDASFQGVGPGDQHVYNLPDNWQGRYWARDHCNGGECNIIASAANPASLAEITFAGWGGNDFYDLSFVDGFNIPVSMAPINPSDQPGRYRCAAPTCSTTPQCPNDMKVYNSAGQFFGCKSACSRYGADEYCCAGAHSTPDTCSPNVYSRAVKAACPDVYSYAYDDTSSTYTCSARGYTITFCP
ncbi:thaumatin [Fennellomyces sp. T-0311]|nr:thaumatin [Fennellomyces sp. T-0311]